MQRALVLLSVVISIAVASCKSSGSAKEGSRGFRSILRGYDTGLAGEGLRIARTPPEWAAMWAEHTAHMLPRPPVPEIDWDREIVVCALMGERPSGGFVLQVDEVDADAKPWTVYVIERTPADGALVPMVVTRPYHLVATPKLGGEPRLAKR